MLSTIFGDLGTQRGQGKPHRIERFRQKSKGMNTLDKVPSNREIWRRVASAIGNLLDPECGAGLVKTSPNRVKPAASDKRQYAHKNRRKV